MTPEQIEVKIPSASGLKVFRMRPPTDEEWLAHHRGRKLVMDRSGNMEPPSRDPDVRLVAAMLLDGSPEPDEYEASLIVARLSRSDVESLERDDQGFRVAVVVGGVGSEHRVKMPTAKQLFRYQRLSTTRDLGRGRSQVCVDVAGLADLHRELVEAPPACSILAKIRVVTAVMNEFQALVGGEENF